MRDNVVSRDILIRRILFLIALVVARDAFDSEENIANVKI